MVGSSWDGAGGLELIAAPFGSADADVGAENAIGDALGGEFLAVFVDVLVHVGFVLGPLGGAERRADHLVQGRLLVPLAGLDETFREMEAKVFRFGPAAGAAVMADFHEPLGG